MSHIHSTPGHIDHTVEVFIIHDGKVLLRKHEKYGIWLSVGGHIELDEDSNQAALRETKEEVGLDIELVAPKNFTTFDEENYEELIPPAFVNRHRINDTHEHVTYTYFATTRSNDVKPESEDDEWKWFTEEEIKEALDLRPHVKYYTLAAFQARYKGGSAGNC